MSHIAEFFNGGFLECMPHKNISENSGSHMVIIISCCDACRLMETFDFEWPSLLSYCFNTYMLMDKPNCTYSLH
jgi:hypothetical protein